MKLARLSPRAERDLETVQEFIAADNPEAAARVRATILNTADFLARNPKLGRPIRNSNTRLLQVRWSVVPRYRNYLIFYQPSGDSIIVIRILHAAQDWTRFF
jgi:toxin ParE1/3/4